MPLTPSHAAVAPLIQRLVRPLGIILPMSALVIGTMAPDFEYLIRLSPGGGDWHTRIGLLEFCLPMGLATWWIFRTLIGPTLIRLLPPALGNAAQARVARGPIHRLLPGAILALMLGAISHDFWDSFTHRFGWGVNHVPWLNHRLQLGPHQWVRYFAILQYASSVIGLLVVLATMWYWVAKQPRGALYVPVGQRAWRVRELGLLIVAAVMGAVLNSSRPRPLGLSWTVGLAAVGAMSALAVALLAYGIIESARHRAATRGLVTSAEL